MVLVPIHCPSCGSEEISKYGKARSGKQNYKCNNKECTRTTFVESYTYKAWDPHVKRQILEMTVNGTGTRACGRVLGISKDTVTNTLKKRNPKYLK